MNYFQERNKGTMKPHDGLTPDQSTLLDWAMGLGGECGEVLDLIKHDIWHSEKADPVELAKELGDVMWYVSAIATAKGVDLDDIMSLNMLKLDYRYGGSFNTDGSLNRKELEIKMKESDEYKQIVKRLTGVDRRPRRIIVIGPDGAGKTTFCKWLQQHTGYEYAKCSYAVEDKVAHAKDLLQKEKVILDRFYYPDNEIYNAVKGITTDPEEAAQLKDIGDQLEAKGETLFIYVYASLATLATRVNTRGDEYIETGELADIRQRYTDFINQCNSRNVPIMLINTDDFSMLNSSHVSEVLGLYDYLIQQKF